MGPARYFLGLEIPRSPNGIYINQRKYALDLISEAGLTGCQPADTPMPTSPKLLLTGGDKLEDPEKYRSLVGRLLYLGFTGPGLAFVTQQLSLFVHYPHQIHCDAALKVLSYLKQNPAQGLFYHANGSVAVESFGDADWASCLDSRKSVTSFCVFLGQSLISWNTKKQSTISRSSAEAEYQSLAATACELKWISYLLQDLKVSLTDSITLWCDNQAAIHIVGNPVFHERTKHIEIDYHHTGNLYKDGFLTLKYLASKSQLANVFTKPLAASRFAELISKLGLVNFHQPQLELIVSQNVIIGQSGFMFFSLSYFQLKLRCTFVYIYTVSSLNKIDTFRFSVFYTRIL